VLYVSETWTLLQEDMHRLQAFEMWIWWRMMEVSRKEHRSGSGRKIHGEYNKNQTEQLDWSYT